RSEESDAKKQQTRGAEGVEGDGPQGRRQSGGRAGKVEQGSGGAKGKAAVKGGDQRKIKLTFKEKLEYTALEKEIEALEAEKEMLEQELNAGGDDYEELQGKSQRVAEILGLMENKMNRWMELGQYI
ncbi:MAG: hypothetical protein LC655_00095, partial [Bacteroidales bacterium]|nr:hypothetical protein [Bacteroidales bacterium]